MATLTADPRLAALRANPLVGYGSLSVVDECWTDAEILTHWEEWQHSDPVKTPADAIEWAIDTETMHQEQGLNARWGEDDDPQLKSSMDWDRRVNAWRKEG